MSLTMRPALRCAVVICSRVTPILGFEESAIACHERFNHHARGGTNYTPAMNWALTQLSDRPERNHMIVLIGDGGTSSADEFIRLVKRCEESQVKVYGLGIETTEMDGLFQRPVQVIHELGQLEGALASLILPELSGGAA